MIFHEIRCPACPKSPVVMEIATGLARGKCPNPHCKRRVWAMARDGRVRIGMVDVPAARIASCA